MKKVNLGIVGLGAIGERLINVFKRHEGYVITKVFDVSTEKMNVISDKYGLITAENFEALINDPSIDVVYLAVPPKFHYEMALKIIGAGKHILCEKPLANSIEEAKGMCDAVKNKPIVHAMNFPLNFTSAYEKINEMLTENELGDIQGIEIHGVFPDWPRLWQVNPWIDSREQGGFTREVFTHFIQLVIHLFGPIEILSSFPRYLDDVHSEISLIATGKVDGQYPILFNGISGVGHHEDIKLKIYGKVGTVELVNWRDLYMTNPTQRLQIDLEAFDASLKLIDALYMKVIGGDAKVIDFESGLETVEVVERLLS